MNITNMTEAWRSGLAFCAIINRFRPDLLDFEELQEEDHMANLSLAFRVAEKELGIPALLDARDMIDVVVIDKLSVLTYLSQFYHKFQGTVPQPIARGSRNPKPRGYSTSPLSSTSPTRTDTISSTSSASSTMSTDSGLDQSSSCSRVSSVSPSPPTSTSSGLQARRTLSRSHESLLDPPREEKRKEESQESSFRAAFRKFSTLSCSSATISVTTSPPKPARQHLVARRSSSLVPKTTSQEVQTDDSTPKPTLVSASVQTEETGLGSRLSDTRVPNCDRNKKNRLLTGIAKYGEMEMLLGRSVDNLALPNLPHRHSVPWSTIHFARTHSTLV